MEWTSIGGLVLTSSVLASVLTALLNNAFAHGRERKKRSEDASFSALQLATDLEAYARRCAEDANEASLFEDTKGSAGSQITTVPEIAPFDAGIDWRALGIVFSDRAFSLRSEVGVARTALSGLWDISPIDTIDVASHKAVQLGAKAWDLASEIRTARGLSQVNRAGLAWDYRATLDKGLATIREMERKPRPYMGVAEDGP